MRRHYPRSACGQSGLDGRKGGSRGRAAGALRHERHAVAALALGDVEAAVGRLDQRVEGVVPAGGADAADRDGEPQVAALRGDRGAADAVAEALREAIELLVRV